MGIHMRVVRASDAERIYEMGMQENVLPYVVYSPSTRFETVQEQYLQPNPHQHQFVAELDGRVVGVVGMMTYAGRRSHIGYLYLYADQECHGQGVGSAMLTKILDLADNWLRLERVELTVLSSNPRAQALYARFGFAVEGRKVAANFAAGQFEDEILMARFRPGGELSRG